MNGRTACLMIAAGVVLVAASAGLADPAEQYAGLFGKEESAVAKLADPNASVAFAARLYDAAKAVDEQKPLQALLCEKAYEYSMKSPAGLPVAASAIKLLIQAQAAPEKRRWAQDRLIEVLDAMRGRSKTVAERKTLLTELIELLMALGDERAQPDTLAEAGDLYQRALMLAKGEKSFQYKAVYDRLLTDRIKLVADAQAAAKKLGTLKAALNSDTRNADARMTLILACLGEFDVPDEAAHLVSAEMDADFRAHVELAAAKLDDLAEETCLDLARWYAAMIDKAPPTSKPALLRKAMDCCMRYIGLHQARDAELLKGTLLLERLERSAEPIAGLPRYAHLPVGRGMAIKLVLLPAGSFVMGGDRVFNNEDGPQRIVTLTRPFYMGVFEVTREQYLHVMEKDAGSAENPRNPVEGVSWYDALEFCKRLSFATGMKVRLPTEAQWEYAARAGTPWECFFGNHPEMLDQYVWYEKNSDKRTHPVGLKKPNPWGLYDIYGNASEWCFDGKVPYHSPIGNVDPVWTKPISERVVRGGRWCDSPIRCSSINRWRDQPEGRFENPGFRVVVEAPAGAASAGK